jgi:hypothetical protein
LQPPLLDAGAAQRAAEGCWLRAEYNTEKQFDNWKKGLCYFHEKAEPNICLQMKNGITWTPLLQHFILQEFSSKSESSSIASCHVIIVFISASNSSGIAQAAFGGHKWTNGKNTFIPEGLLPNTNSFLWHARCFKSRN